MINLYLDIDGTLIQDACINPTTGLKTIASGALELLQFSVNHFNCFWLSYYARGKKPNNISRVFRDALDVQVLPNEWTEVFGMIKNAKWTTNKTQGIDLNIPFFWIDDNVSDADQDFLKNNGVFATVINVNLDRNPNDLHRVLQILKVSISGKKQSNLSSNDKYI